MNKKFNMAKLFLVMMFALIICSGIAFTLEILSIYVGMHIDYEKRYKDRGDITTRTFKSNYYTSNFAESTDDYYYINLMEDDVNTIYAARSIPSKYVVDIDASYQFIDLPRGDIYEYTELEFEKPVVDNLTINLYEIGSDKLVKTIDAKQIILDNVGKAFISNAPFRTISMDGKLYFGVDLVNIIDRYEYKNPEKTLTRNTLYIDLESEEVVFNPSMTADWITARSRYVDIFSSDFLHDNMKNTPFITSMYYWKDCVKLSFTTDRLPENNTKLYEKFPDLRQKLDELNKEGKKARLEVVLTGNPSYEEIMELIMEDGKEPVFNDVKISEKDSTDGLEHEVHSFDDWRKYYRLDEADMSLVSEILPR